jgi:hypothetical protein
MLREALTHPGPAIIEAIVDPTEPPLPGHVTTKQAWNFAKALARGQEDRWDILKTVATNTVRDGNMPTCWWVKKVPCARCAKRRAMQLLQSILHDRIRFHISEVS